MLIGSQLSYQFSPAGLEKEEQKKVQDGPTTKQSPSNQNEGWSSQLGLQEQAYFMKEDRVLGRIEGGPEIDVT
jgi:hypothetical protein